MDANVADERTPFWRSLDEETPRACVILGVAGLDAGLEVLIRNAMVEKGANALFREDRALGGFSIKCKIAFAMGLISENEYADLDILRRIRNDFAHLFDGTLSFDTPPSPIA